jgi:hypothetical protein
VKSFFLRHRRIINRHHWNQKNHEVQGQPSKKTRSKTDHTKSVRCTVMSSFVRKLVFRGCAGRELITSVWLIVASETLRYSTCLSLDRFPPNLNHFPRAHISAYSTEEAKDGINHKNLQQSQVSLAQPRPVRAAKDPPVRQPSVGCCILWPPTSEVVRLAIWEQPRAFFGAVAWCSGQPCLRLPQVIIGATLLDTSWACMSRIGYDSTSQNSVAFK